MKIIRSDRSCKYYGKYDESGTCPGPFTKFLKQPGICTRYIMRGTPQRNGVAEKSNRTLMKMVRSMMSNSSLPLSLWINALRTAMYLLNRAPSKVVPNTHFKL